LETGRAKTTAGSWTLKNLCDSFTPTASPPEEAYRYDASVAPILLRMMNDPREQDYWSNIVTTLGIIGDENAVEPMIEFIEKGKVGQPWNRSKAKESATTSLGYLINRSGNQRTLDYLIGNMTPRPRPDGDLSKYAVMGLALSGHPKAAAALKSLPKSPGKREALRINQEVADKGLLGYYRASRRP